MNSNNDLPLWARVFKRVFVDPQASRVIGRHVRDPWDQLDEWEKLDERFGRFVRKLQGPGN
ncbi:hypothetical protein CcI156_05910 [Frankia sp. CcI156]|uniref:hypothetical protein n=1 Tax=Frankia TaxID=1854 RepID=UPI0003CFB8E4|nr:MULTISPECIES: hypothetical protein [Frankia]ETA01698.1 hypothetical protein CcI6DRAFT_02878 [Frankia sp. CcI6]KFB03860.1 hypothetical protein ALLO2DRAFT_03376 [Frankia sp. Allo2]OAA29090.1 hypothetical protein AAY23_101723 [Frankia casuarinae]OHV48518.1 hypothetical protein CgIS1_05775 [Frankia sp. CgIS1]ONH28244.1 hypothetical protein CcI156_05910 [Frankia sp. CcI156]